MRDRRKPNYYTPAQRDLAYQNLRETLLCLKITTDYEESNILRKSFWKRMQRVEIENSSIQPTVIAC